MTEISRIHDQLTRAFDGNAWSGPSLLATLAHLTARQAAARPVPQAHTIWEIVLHLTSWVATVRQRLEQRQATPLPDAHDWPAQPRELSEELWQTSLYQLRAAHQALLATVAGLQEADLAVVIGPEPAGGCSVYVLLHGLAQHNLYHAGQISLLRKALTA